MVLFSSVAVSFVRLFLAQCFITSVSSYQDSDAANNKLKKQMKTINQERTQRRKMDAQITDHSTEQHRLSLIHLSHSSSTSASSHSFLSCSTSPIHPPLSALSSLTLLHGAAVYERVSWV